MKAFIAGLLVALFLGMMIQSSNSEQKTIDKEISNEAWWRQQGF